MITPERIQEVRVQVGQLTDEFISLTDSIGHEELRQTAEDLKQHIYDPFLFVIVGEVKAGKSSFINALLKTDKDICKVAPSPMTDTIQQIVYGPQESEVAINDYLKKIYHPVEILKEICIVDTPGTNTIIDHHQEITERFIPAADLIVFVFEAKNPYRESSWKFFDFINAEWWKKVIFVLQQKDLMPENDLAINLQGVKDQAIKKGIVDPRVYAVSAKEEKEGVADSGYAPLRSYIDDNILGGKAPIIKQSNHLGTLLNMANKVQSGLDVRKAQYEADISFREDIRETLQEQEVKSAKQVDFLVENLIAEYDNVTRPKLEEIKEGLGFFSLVNRSLKSTFSGKKSPKDWLHNLLADMEKSLNNNLKHKLNDGVIDIADSIQQMGKMVDLKLRNSKTILKDDHEIFSNIAERRANVLKELQQSFSDFLSDSDNFYDKELAKSSESISPNLAAAGGIATIGVILAAITNGMVFDITGGVLTAAGLVFAGASTFLKRRKIVSEFTAEIDRGREQFHTEVSSGLKSYITKIKERIDDNFNRFDEHLEKEGADIKSYNDRLDKLGTSVQELQANIA